MKKLYRYRCGYNNSKNYILMADSAEDAFQQLLEKDIISIAHKDLGASIVHEVEGILYINEHY